MIPWSTLEKVHTQVSGRRRFKLADGNVEEFQIGEAYVEIQGVGATSIVLFGRDDSQPLLGVTTLENLGLEVNPVTGELKPVELYLL